MSIFINIVVWVLIIIGLILTLVTLPGIWLIFLGIVVYATYNGFQDITLFQLGIFLLITIIGGFVDNIAILWGAKKFGASKWGILGAIIGLIAGFFIGNLVGMLFGAFLGAVFTEVIIENKENNKAIKAGVGTIVGFATSILLKFIIGIGMVIAWLLIVS